MSRKTARKHIFNIIFQLEFNEITDIDINEVLETYSEEYENTDGRDKKFIISECSGIFENISKIDEIINAVSKGWSVDRLSKVDLAILRIAVYEINFDDDIPNKVAANEAVELAKEFSTDKSPVFINGIIGKLISEGV